MRPGRCHPENLVVVVFLDVGVKASMRPERCHPGKLAWSQGSASERCPFNEAGAFTPRKLPPFRMRQYCDSSSFNEAGALPPRKSDNVRWQELRAYLLQ